MPGMVKGGLVKSAQRPRVNQELMSLGLCLNLASVTSQYLMVYCWLMTYSLSGKGGIVLVPNS